MNAPHVHPPRPPHYFSLSAFLYKGQQFAALTLKFGMRCELWGAKSPNVDVNLGMLWWENGWVKLNSKWCGRQVFSLQHAITHEIEKWLNTRSISSFCRLIADMSICERLITLPVNNRQCGRIVQLILLVISNLFIRKRMDVTVNDVKVKSVKAEHQSES